jgi:hypothetical protein
MSMERGHARILDDQSRLEYYFGNDAENWLNRTFAITPKKGTPIPIHSKKVMNKEGGGAYRACWRCFGVVFLVVFR